LTGVAVTGPMTVQNNNSLALPTGIANNGTDLSPSTRSTWSDSLWLDHGGPRPWAGSVIRRKR
jgi:hypothetical protein